VRIEAIDTTGGQVKIPLSAWMAYETRFRVAAQTKRSNLGSSRLMVQGSDSRIVLPQQAGMEGLITIYSRSKAHHAQVLQQVRNLVSDLRFTSSMEPQPFLPDTIRPRQRVRAGGVVDHVPNRRTPATAPSDRWELTVRVVRWVAMVAVLGIVIIVLVALFIQMMGR
jgi:hypothetical protein